jgi:hypothetical protein
LNTREPLPIPQQAEIAVKEEVEIETVGLPEELRELGSWAANTGVQSPLFLVLDATGASTHPRYSGTALAYLTHPAALICINNWRDELPFLPDLGALIHACQISPYILKKFSALQVTRWINKHMKDGDLEKLPLIALLARPVQEASSEVNNWLEALRAWCFVHFLDAIHSGAEPSRYLLDVTSKLRLGIDRDPDWIDIFVRLKGSTSSFFELTRHLNSSAQGLLHNQANPIKGSSHKALLETLQNFCQGKSPRSNLNPTTSVSGGLFKHFRALPSAQILPPALWLSPRPQQETQDNLDAENQGFEIFDTEDLDRDANQVVGVDENDTPANQEVKSKKVLLSSVEDYQFLTFSWNRPNAFERQALTKWLDQTWLSSDLSKIRLATLVFAAIQSGNSLRTILFSTLTSVSSDDWSLDVSGGFLHRHPPRRDAGWRSTADTDAWVSPRASQIQIALPSAAVAALTQLLSVAPDALTLLELWTAELPPEQQFRALCRATPGLQRVTSGMLAYMLEQSSFETSTDAVLSQLLASHPSSGLPGSCAYASYSLVTVQTTIQVIATPSAPTYNRLALLHEDDNAAGSELCPIESLVREACADALTAVNLLAVDPLQWPLHHNAFTAYCVVVLLAAMGGRPVTSPHESIRNFDFKTLQIYIEDKVSSSLNQGRLLPLPRFAAELIEQHYLPHLARVAQLIGGRDPAMSKEITLLASGQPSLKLPLFFLLEANPKLSWIEVSEKTLSALGLFKWPLPWNLMRHRLPTQLKRMGANHETINGLTGHGEQGTSAYGYYSTRVWQEDADASQQMLAELLGRLSLGFPEKPAWPLARGLVINPASAGSAVSDEDVYGLEARRARRKQAHDKVVQQATREIEAFVNPRPLDSLSPDEWETLSRQMLLRAKSHPDQARALPHHDGSLRYETLRHWITKNWLDSGSKPRIKKRYLPLLEEASPFTPDCIGANARLTTAYALLRTSFASSLARAPSRRDALSMGIVLLMAESRVADMKVLDDLLKCQHFRVQRFNDIYFLEHAPSLDRYPSSPVRRYKIGEMTAGLLATARSGGYKLNIATRALSPPLQRLAQALGMDGDGTANTIEFIKEFATTVNQANAQRFPGVVAAYLNGQIVTVGLGHLDWVRVQVGNAVQLPQIASPVSEKNVADPSEHEFEVMELAEPDVSYVFMAPELAGAPEIEKPKIAPKKTAPTSNPATTGVSDHRQAPVSLAFRAQQAQKQSHDFFQALRDTLSSFEKESSSPRRNLDFALRRVIRDNPLVSRSCRLLGEWIRSLLWRQHRGKLLTISALKRYFNALSVCFEAVASEHDLLASDGDEVTVFYQEVMEARWAIRPHTYIAVPPSDAAPASEVRAQEEAASISAADPQTIYKTRRLALQLLRDFHRLMSRTIALEDPDWSEIDAGDDVLSISPGVILEKEYQYALSLAAPQPESASREDLARAFILIVAMRFGLRGAEITGLMRTDWVDLVVDSEVVLVQKNRYRDLKSPAARRQVPLLFTLSIFERRIIDRFLALWNGIARGDVSIPLFVSSTDSTKLLSDKFLRWQVSQLIKQATLNPDLSLHHARHTFGNRVGLILLDGTGSIWSHCVAEPPSKQDCSHVRKLLLCTEGVTRRSLWALARLLGHAHPHTTVRSYLHFLPELADLLVWKNQKEFKKNWPTLIDVSLQLHELEIAPGYLAPVETAAAPTRLPAPSPQAALRFLYLYQQGASLERASFSAAIETTDAQTLVKVINNIDDTLARRHHINPKMGGTSTLLSHIRPERWTRLIEQAAAVVVPSSRPLTSWELLESGLKMIGPSRQILLYRERDFKLFKQIVVMWSLPASSFKIVSQQATHARLQAWADANELEIEKAAESKVPSPQGKGLALQLKPLTVDLTLDRAQTPIQNGQHPEHPKTQKAVPRRLKAGGLRKTKGDAKDASKLQIDVVEDGDPPTPQRHRCAVIPTPSKESLLTDSFQLSMLVSVTLFLFSSTTTATGTGGDIASSSSTSIATNA